MHQENSSVKRQNLHNFLPPEVVGDFLVFRCAIVFRKFFLCSSSRSLLPVGVVLLSAESPLKEPLLLLLAEFGSPPRDDRGVVELALLLSLDLEMSDRTLL